MDRNNEYVELFALLSIQYRSAVRNGRLRCSYTALRRYGMMHGLDRKRTRAEWSRRGGELLDTIKAMERVSGAEKLAKRQRRVAADGKSPEFVWNQTPPTWSGDLEAFFIPPNHPEREFSWSEIRVRRPIGKKPKHFTRKT